MGFRLDRFFVQTVTEILFIVWLFCVRRMAFSVDVLL